jgi:hypothetical protein
MIALKPHSSFLSQNHPELSVRLSTASSIGSGFQSAENCVVLAMGVNVYAQKFNGATIVTLSKCSTDSIFIV